jgi:hypothetical protein
MRRILPNLFSPVWAGMVLQALAGTDNLFENNYIPALQDEFLKGGVLNNLEIFYRTLAIVSPTNGDGFPFNL